MALSQGHMFYIGLYRENHEKKFLSETIKLRALFNLLQVLICWVIAQNLQIHNTATGHGNGQHAEKISKQYCLILAL